MWQWLYISFDITEFVCCWKITYKHNSTANVFRWFQLNFCRIVSIYLWFLESRLPVSDVFFLFSLCKVVSLLGRLKVTSNLNIGCIIHTKAEEVACSCLHATHTWNLWINWWSCDVRLLGLQFVNTIQNDFTSRTRLLS
jgi:hypothetical protein